jgi:protein-L-isoaspartate(D-aspartate) O-methyltransferase
MAEADEVRTESARLILRLRSAGVIDAKVLNALQSTPRDLFVPELFRERAWEDSALPIACGQTISQPYIVGLMTQALSLESRHRVLEIGTGSGYQTAVLSKLVRYVYTIERYRTLLSEAEARLKQLDVQNVISRFGDGMEGWPEQAPFDRIIVTAAMPEEPKRLLKQVKPNGILVAPVGRGAVQALRRYVGDGEGGFRTEELCDVRVRASAGRRRPRTLTGSFSNR